MSAKAEMELTVDVDARWLEIQSISNRIAAADTNPTELESALCGAVYRAREFQRQLTALSAELEAAREAMKDALSGWRYIRETHGDLYGVGWDRVEQKLTAAMNRSGA